MPRSSRTIALILVVLAAAPAAAAPQRIVLVAPPGLAGEITPAVAASLTRAFEDALARVGVRPATDAEVEAAMRKAGVSSTKTRADSTLVGKKLGATALVRYQAKLVGFDLRVRLAVYFLAGKAAMIERNFPLRELESNADQMVAELFGAPPANAAPPAEGPASRPAPAAATQPTSAPVAPAKRSSTARVFAEANPYAQSGLVFRGSFSGAAPVGYMASTLEALSIGFRAGGDLGYQIRLGRYVALTPEVAFGFARWGSNENWNALYPPGAITALSIAVGARFDLFLGPVSIWPALRLGLGRAALSYEDSAVGDTISDLGFAIDFAFGVQWMLARGFGLGLVLGAHKVFVSEFVSDPDNSGPSGFTFGLQLTAKIPTGA